MLVDRFYIRWPMYLIGAALINTFIFIQHEAWKDNGKVGHDLWSNESHYLWYGFARIFFILGLAFILMPLLFGHGLLARKFLGADIWTPLARLSFTAYLIHYAILQAVFVSQKKGYYLEDRNLFWDCIAAVVCSYAAALPISLLVESPSMNLEKILFRPRSRN